MTLAVAPHADAVATQQIVAFAYDELKRIARHHLRGTDGRITLSPTELVHEAYLRLGGTASFSGRAHFFGAAARAMRQVLVDFARRRRAGKRGGDYRRVSLRHAERAMEVELDDVLALDAALARLAALDPRLVQVVELRFFAGLCEREIASLLGVTPRTVERDWLKARLLLLDVLARGAR
jgi:RNA polymerase sigma factor (TIGR02999 family)